MYMYTYPTYIPVYNSNFEAMDCQVKMQDYTAVHANPYWLHNIYLVSVSSTCDVTHSYVT